jgi:hypothetical protein
LPDIALRFTNDPIIREAAQEAKEAKEKNAGRYQRRKAETNG